MIRDVGVLHKVISLECFHLVTKIIHLHGDDDRAQKPYKILKVLIQVARAIYVVW
jgi:hypothetical protein